jgi:hypothetical protein
VEWPCNQWHTFSICQFVCVCVCLPLFFCSSSSSSVGVMMMRKRTRAHWSAQIFAAQLHCAPGGIHREYVVMRHSIFFFFFRVGKGKRVFPFPLLGSFTRSCARGGTVHIIHLFIHSIFSSQLEEEGDESIRKITHSRHETFTVEPIISYFLFRKACVRSPPLIIFYVHQQQQQQQSRSVCVILFGNSSSFKIRLLNSP